MQNIPRVLSFPYRALRKIGRIVKGKANFFAYSLRNLRTDPYVEFFHSETYFQKGTFPGINNNFLTPIPVSVSPASPVRVNIIIDTVTDLFGGYIATYHLAQRLMQEGYQIRFLMTDRRRSNLPQDIEHWDGFRDFFQHVGVYHCWQDVQPLEVNPRDQFIARSWSACYIAHELLRHVQRDRFIYLAQDFEPIFYCHGTQHALARHAFALPQYTLFSSELLRDFVRQSKIGVFARPDGDNQSASFENPIDTFPVDPQRLAARTTRKLLFYVRPSTPRNMFELGYLALLQAIRNGCFCAGQWEFYGMGTRGATRTIDLADGYRLRTVPRMSLKEYRQFLPQFDIGLSLMLSPHPSLVPLDMAAAGLVTVTNTYANKTPEALHAISSNILAVEPSIEAIAGGLQQAVEKISGVPQRVAGTRIHWARTWDEAFNDAIIAKLKQWIA
ncbi:MAG: hypothetical protein PHI63_00605 [Patescibacteria group bacterium]|nr:hypothetical protein [Patescibacteria group bacterium]